MRKAGDQLNVHHFQPRQHHLCGEGEKEKCPPGIYASVVQRVNVNAELVRP